MVRIGVSESWGSEIRGTLGASLNNRFKAFLSGLGVSMLLQSSSATALLTASFSGQGILTTATALAILLGADVGTTLVRVVAISARNRRNVAARLRVFIRHLPRSST